MEPVSNITEQNPYASQKLGQIGSGLIAGPAAELGIRGVGSVISPSIQAAAQTLIEHGYDPYKLSVG